MRGMLRDVQHTNPAIRGISFCGSRVLGVEKEDSDMDVFVFYDSQIQKKIRSRVDTKTIERSFPIKKELGRHMDTPMGFEFMENAEDIFSLDISRDSLKKTIEYFRDRVDILTENFSHSPDLNAFHRPGDRRCLELVGLFYLAIGDPVYRARRYVLDELEQLPNGDQYYEVLIRLLSFYERESSPKRQLPAYKNYPPTIEEAKKYFITQTPQDQPEDVSPEMEEFYRSNKGKIAAKRILSKLNVFKNE